MTILLAPLFVFLAILLLASWVLVCNQRTLTKRLALIDRRHQFIRAHNWEVTQALHDEMERVSYEAHLWRLLTLRSPKPLYGPKTNSIWSP